MRAWRFTSILILCSWHLAVVGCTRGLKSEPVEVLGQVTVDGQPLSGAVITLEPIEGTRGPKASAPIFNGSYRIEASSNLQPGSYLVRISMLPAEIAKQLESSSISQTPAPVRNRAISPEFDGLSRLKVLLEAGEQNHADFEVSYR